MKNLFKALILLLVVSCASTKPTESDVILGSSNAKDIDKNIDLISTDMASLNSRMRAKLIRKEKYKSFDHIDNSLYLKKIHEYQDPSEVDYINYLDADDIEIVTKGRNLNFAVCTRSIKFKFVLCDKANSILIDFVSKDLFVDLHKKANDLLLN